MNNVTQRGKAVMLPHGGLPEIISPHLFRLIEKTGGPKGPIGLQFVAQPQLEKKHWTGKASDPLLEDEHEVAPGLVYKYRSGQTKNGVKYFGRALWTITRSCASYCRFCTRGREVGLVENKNESPKGALSHSPFLSKEQVDKTLAYIRSESKNGLNEIILSGGDPLTLNKELLTYVLQELSKLQKENLIKIIRIGTRVPVHNPLMIQDWMVKVIANIKNPRIMIHVNHPEELTPDTLRVLERLRLESHAIIMTQSVLLKGVNDSVDTLLRLFEKLAENGIIPYYVYQNDPVYWAKHLTVPIKKAIILWSQVRPLLSGVAATARLVIDTPNGFGKIPVPEGSAWQVDYEKGFSDFKKKKMSLNIL